MPEPGPRRWPEMYREAHQAIVERIARVPPEVRARLSIRPEPAFDGFVATYEERDAEMIRGTSGAGSTHAEAILSLCHRLEADWGDGSA